MKCNECPVYSPYTKDYRWCQGTKPNNLDHDCIHGKSVKGKKFKINRSEETNDE